MKNLKGRIRLHLWIESEKGMMLGLGRAQLIENIEKYGSLQNAAKKMGISYRAAWGSIKKTEEVLGYKLLERNAGGYHLTELGKELDRKFKTWFDGVENYALQEAKKIFPWVSTSYRDKD